MSKFMLSVVIAKMAMMVVGVIGIAVAFELPHPFILAFSVLLLYLSFTRVEFEQD